MRDFRDAKLMAHTLRDALKAKAVETTHSESLELVARLFGCESWNVLAARIEAAAPPRGTAPAAAPPRDALPSTLHCSFCGKTQHQVRKLVAGPAVFICDECIDICTDIVDEPGYGADLLRLMEEDADSARAMPSPELMRYTERARNGIERNRYDVTCIERLLSGAQRGTAGDDILMSPRFAPRYDYLRNKPAAELPTLKDFAQKALARYENVLRVATLVLKERERPGDGMG